MSDPRTSLPAILAELHTALEESVDLGAEARSELREAAGEIQAALDRPGSDPLPGSIGDRLSAALERFEGSHPRLTGFVGRVADALSDLGI